jgi:hypothetical protein
MRYLKSVSNVATNLEKVHTAIAAIADAFNMLGQLCIHCGDLDRYDWYDGGFVVSELLGVVHLITW